MEPSVPEEISQLEAIKARLIDPRTVSKTTDEAGRIETAGAIFAARAERHEKGGEVKAQEEALQKETTGVRKALDKVRSLIKGPDATKSALIEARLGVLKAEHDDIPNPRDLLNAYYEKVATTPLTVDEKRELLKPEVLEILTTDEYIALWKRLNPFYMAHVTRQGFRDHVGSFYHSGSQGVFSDGLGEILRDEKLLRSPAGAMGLRGLDQESVSIYLRKYAALHPDFNIFLAESEEEVRKRADLILDMTMARAPNYPDKTAVHLSSNMPLDQYYGAEQGNEVFMIFPTDYLASQYSFSVNHPRGENLTDKRDRFLSDMDNDVLIWPGTMDNPGVPIDSGLVFLPAVTPVDPETGSKYASTEERIDGQLVRLRIRDEEVTRKFQNYLKGRRDEPQPLYLDEKIKKILGEFSSEQLSSLGLSPDAVASFRGALVRQYSPEQAFELANGSWRRAENPIASKNYWEGFFNEHPELKPKHVVYYGSRYMSWNTASAVGNFFSDNNIGRTDTSERDGQLLGFDANYLGQADHLEKEQGGDPWLGYDEVKEAIIQAGLKNLRERSQASEFEKKAA